MSLELVKDEFGATMELYRCPDGRLVAPDFNPDTVCNMKNIPLRDDDIMLCSYPKSGCHWLWDVLRHLRFGQVDDLDNTDKETYMVEFNSLEKLEQLQSPRILNNHGFFEDQPRDVFVKNLKVVFVYRNVKDLAVSYYHHHIRFPEYKYQDTFTHYIRRFAAGLVDNGSVFEYLRGWEKGMLNTPAFDFHVVSYEDMKEDSERELLRLSEFLGTSTDVDFLKAVAKATDFEAMKKKKSISTMYMDSDGEPVMYRKGQVGDWMNHFTVADDRWMDTIIERELGHLQLLTFRYEL
ncbi:hypothetical protein BsWGS_10107 [Bradybaena similaris]